MPLLMYVPEVGKAVDQLQHSAFKDAQLLGYDIIVHSTSLSEEEINAL